MPTYQSLPAGHGWLWEGKQIGVPLFISRNKELGLNELKVTPQWIKAMKDWENMGDILT